MFANYDGRAADAEHQQQQRRHMYVVYVSLLIWHARFALEGICKSMAIEIRVVLIHSRDFWFFSHAQVCISGDTPSFHTGIFALNSGGNRSGASLLTQEECRKVLGRSLTTPYKCDYEFIVWGGRISKKFYTLIFCMRFLSM